MKTLDFNAESVIRAYINGFFPTPDANGRLVWEYAPRRCVVPVRDFRVPKNTRRHLRQGRFELRIDASFEEVVRACADRPSTWITDDVIRVYVDLHEMGVAHSIEAWEEGELVGGLYGLAIGRFFAGESQFHRVTEAGTVAFAHLLHLLREQDFLLHDAQFLTPHLARFGAVELPHADFMNELMRAVSASTGLLLPGGPEKLES